MLNIVHPFRAAVALSLTGLVLAMAPTGVARADSSGVEANPHLTAHQRHNVRDIVSRLPVCTTDQPSGCKYVRTGNGHNITLASFRADRRQYLVAVKYDTPRGRIIHVEVYR